MSCLFRLLYFISCDDSNFVPPHAIGKINYFISLEFIGRWLFLVVVF